MQLPTLNLIGPGKLGFSLAGMLHAAGLVSLQAVASRDESGAHAAVDKLGTGMACTLANLPTADLTLIATPDAALAQTATALARNPQLQAGRIVWHASGALASSELNPLRARGLLIASVHPLRSFATAANTLAGTHCGCEGDDEALAVLEPLHAALGAHCFRIDPAHKTLYHAAAVLACNDLVALMDHALHCMAAAGVAREQAWPALRPLIDGTLANLDRLPPAAALTGPVARGDIDTVARQLTATNALDAQVGAVYRTLARSALRLAQMDATRRDPLNQLLSEQP
ncbi:Rossmann-like and DUF2520 domain-containing protein [Chitinimonas sp. BJYL2]|uniref:Rossmann-like and DUF2520 domain-containing protein n=1 Tax=Chitinimonas sp. BJYL2 TaxID=2976696 RepID=UPI0022B49608|nr:Rossmann-like and DUF2520 domain-containing protein [Chitinimonas sp. BJYL2]